MALRINTNVAALSAHQSMIKNDSKLSESLGRLSTGLRINKAADDASGMAIADSLRAQHLGIGQAVRNANDGISMVQTADGALEESINIINTIKTKAIQAASDSQTTDTRKAIQADIDALMEELDVIAQTTSYNGQKLLSGVFTNKKIQIGAFANETASVSIGSTESNKIGHISTATLSLASDTGGEVQLTITSSKTGEDLTLNTVDIQSNNSAENGIGALADEINRYTSITGISATEVVEATSGSAIAAGTTGSDFSINGINIGAITVTNNDGSGALVSAINGKTTEHGVTASMNNDGTMTLTSTDGRAIDVDGSISDVFGSTSSQMSTIGYLNLSQSGTSQFQINGIGAGATGGDLEISVDVTTVEDSILASGSTIKAGSNLAAGTIVGGDTMVEAQISSTQLDTEMVAGSTLYSFSEVNKGTVLGGAVTIAGSTIDSTAAAGMTAIEQDMLVASGSTLKENTILGKGTVVTTEFTSSASGTVTTYEVGDVLTSAVELSRDITLSADMTLKYSDTATDSSHLKADSTLTAGTQMGVKIEIGATYNQTDGSGAIATGATTTSAIILEDNLADGTTATAGTFTIKAGSYLKDNTELVFTASTSWSGPTLVTDSGVIEAGDVVSADTVYTLSGDQILSEDVVTADSTTATSTIFAGSILASGFVNGQNAVGGTAGAQVTLSTATLSQDMTLKSGSELSVGSSLLAGSTLGNNTYVMGGPLDATLDDISTYDRTELKSGSVLEKDSTLAEGSTVGGTVTLKNDETLDSDMSVTTGTLLKDDTMLLAGTVINQDMTLDSTADGDVTVSVKAGDVLTTNMLLEGDHTLSADMMLLEDSIVKADSELAVNTTNSGTVGLSDTQNMRLSDINVLTQEGAQFAISIADAALADLDSTRSGLGSVQNQLTSTIANLATTKTNIQASESAIRDVDFAEEASTYSKLNLLSQTSSYALAQANASSQNVMSLLQ